MTEFENYTASILLARAKHRDQASDECREKGDNGGALRHHQIAEELRKQAKEAE